MISIDKQFYIIKKVVTRVQISDQTFRLLTEWLTFVSFCNLVRITNELYMLNFMLYFSHNQNYTFYNL